jgi:hypothetical protein
VSNQSAVFFYFPFFFSFRDDAAKQVQRFDELVKVAVDLERLDDRQQRRIANLHNIVSHESGQRFVQQQQQQSKVFCFIYQCSIFQLRALQTRRIKRNQTRQFSSRRAMRQGCYLSKRDQTALRRRRNNQKHFRNLRPTSSFAK